MMLKLLQKKIQKAFSDQAHQYDVLSSLQKEIGRELILSVSSLEQFQYVLDVGMGTGYVTQRLKNVFLDSVVVGCDFADGMIEEANREDQDFYSVQADAHDLPFKNETFDIVVSNLSYQWMQDLSLSFEKCYNVLKPSGNFCATMFGHGTFDELFVSLAESMRPNHLKESLPIRRLSSKEDVLRALEQAGFCNSEVNVETIKVRFPDVKSLIRWIRDIGANALERDFYMGKDLLLRTEEYYHEHYKDALGIYATFEILWIKGVAKK